MARLVWRLSLFQKAKVGFDIWKYRKTVSALGGGGDIFRAALPPFVDIDVQFACDIISKSFAFRIVCKGIAWPARAITAEAIIPMKMPIIKLNLVQVPARFRTGHSMRDYAATFGHVSYSS